MGFNVGKRFAAVLFAAAILIGAVSFAIGQSIDGKGEVRIIAQKLEDGRIQFGLEQDGERILPRARFFPSNARVGNWLKSSPIYINQVQAISRSSSTTPQTPTTGITHSHCQRVRVDGGCDRRFRPVQCPSHSHQSLVGHRNDHC